MGTILIILLVLILLGGGGYGYRSELDRREYTAVCSWWLS